MTTKKVPLKKSKAMAFLEKLTGKKMTFGNLLLSIRQCEEMSQVDFAKKLDISRQYLCDIEQGRRTVSSNMAAEFAVKLGYSPLQFIRLSVQDELNKHGFKFDVEISDRRKAA
jgi:transcriptional regulator with XRE-family HTH domain